MTPINQQIETMRALALRHYPEDEAARNAWLVSKLEERLREFAAMRLPVREMTR
jgi:hypothetical protein